MKWDIVHKYDNKNGDPKKWVCKISEEQSVYIDRLGTDSYGVTKDPNGNKQSYLFNAGTLYGAKWWVTDHLDDLLKHK